MIFIGKCGWNGSVQITLKKSYSITNTERAADFFAFKRE